MKMEHISKLEFFSYDYELVKISEAYHYDKNNKLIGKYDRITSNDKKIQSSLFCKQIHNRYKSEIGGVL